MIMLYADRDKFVYDTYGFSYASAESVAEITWFVKINFNLICSMYY